MTLKIFQSQPLVIAALHLPDFARSRHRSMAWFEDYALANAGVFAEAGIPWLKLQDETLTDGAASPESIARTATIARVIRASYPQIGLGIILAAHDSEAALSIADAAGADFVRLKVFVGGVMTAGGPRYGCGAQATAHRATLRRPDIALLADVHDRTAVPLSAEDQPFAAEWAVKTGADGLIITGSSFADTQARIAVLRQRGRSQPILIGGGVTADNVATALSCADGAIVSTALMRPRVEEHDLIRWDLDRCAAFMDAARNAPSRPPR